VAGVGSFFGKFFGRTVGDAASFAIGGSISRTIDPVLQQVENEAWQAAVTAGAVRPLDAGTAAAIVAEDVEKRGWGETQAAQGGIGREQFGALLGEALNAPGIGPLFELWRRGLIDGGQFAHGLRKAKLEPEWDAPLRGLHDALLSSQELAMMQQQGFIDEAHANAEGALQGVTTERQQLRFEASGLPPGIGEALTMLRRGIIDAGTFAQIVREGHTKTKYTDELLALEPEVLHATDYAGLRLRGWITPEESYAGGALTGYSPAQMDDLWRNRGRPATTHQVWIGLQRGGKYDGESLTERETFTKAVLQSDLRPEWEPLLWAQRYTYPSAFVLRALASSGDLTQAETESILLFTGWEPTLAAKVSAKWAGSHGAAAKEATAANLRAEYEGLFISRAELETALVKLGYSQSESSMLADLGDAARVKKSRDEYIGVVHKAYLAHEIQAAQARADLDAAGIDAAAIDHLLHFWTLSLAVSRKQLTPAQIAASFKRGTITLAVALADLADRGYTPEDAQTLLGLAAPVLTVAQIEAAVRRGTITRDAAVAQLEGQGYSVEQANELLGAAAPLLTVAQIEAAYKGGVIDRATAFAQLTEQGYSEAQANELLDTAKPPPPPPA
jgi:hypothetical protein